MNRGHLYIISAPSGAGKSSLIKVVLQRNSGRHLGVSISHTTREQRPGEQDGVNYYFVDKAKFETMIQQQAFIEHAEVFGQYYGTSHHEIDRRLEQGWDIFLDIDWQGARQVRTYFPDSRSIFILPPSQAELQQRLIKRNQDSELVIQQRMLQAVSEMSHYNEYDYLIINDDFERATAELQTIIASDWLRQAPQANINQQLIAELLR